MLLQAEVDLAWVACFRPYRVTVAFGNDINDAGEGIGTINGRAGAADKFNAFNIVQGNIGKAEHVAANGIVIDFHTVEKNQDLGIRRFTPSAPDRCGADGTHFRSTERLHAGNIVHQILNGRYWQHVNISGSENRYAGRNILQCLFRQGGAGDGNVAEFFQRQGK